jgi:hypothetical protein
MIPIVFRGNLPYSVIQLQASKKIQQLPFSQFNKAISYRDRCDLLLFNSQQMAHLLLNHGANS